MSSSAHSSSDMDECRPERVKGTSNRAASGGAASEQQVCAESGQAHTVEASQK
jgi:hypothetical protein